MSLICEGKAYCNTSVFACIDLWILVMTVYYCIVIISWGLRNDPNIVIAKTDATANDYSSLYEVIEGKWEKRIN